MNVAIIFVVFCDFTVLSIIKSFLLLQFLLSLGSGVVELSLLLDGLESTYEN